MLSPSVVFVATSEVRRQRTGFFSSELVKIEQGTGSGFIWDKAGHIVTNHHVIAASDLADVTLMDGSVWEAKLVGVEIDKDLAVIKIDAPADQLHPIQIGESHDLQKGQFVMAIGNPFGLDYTCTTGIIGGLGREIESATKHPILNVIQTDAAINPGNSGGPLIDSAGLLIGVNTAIYSPTGASAGIGFAVPVDTVNRIVPQLITHGKVIKPDLGLELQYYSRYQRPVVANVIRNSGAHKAGILPPHFTQWGHYSIDLIHAINGQTVQYPRDVYRITDKLKIGDTVKVTLQRGNKLHELDVKLTASS